MRITVTGGSQSQKKHTKEMVKFCIKTLMPRMKTLDIDVKLCKPTGALGYCLELDNKREFELEIDKTQPLRRLLETVAHEMVHVKQLVYKEFFTECNFYKTHEEYMNLPWEIEAYEMQEVLLERWKCHKKKF